MKQLLLVCVLKQRAGFGWIMRKFVFNLDRLERVRGIEQDRAAQTLSRREASRIECERTLAACKTELARCYDGRRPLPGETLSAEMLLALDQYGQVAKILVKKAEETLTSAVLDEAAARTALLERSRERKVVEKYRERRFEAYRVESLREEQKELDDSASVRKRRIYR